MKGGDAYCGVPGLELCYRAGWSVGRHEGVWGEKLTGGQQDEWMLPVGMQGVGGGEMAAHVEAPNTEEATMCENS